MFKKLRRSIELMPRPAYIYLIMILKLCCILLITSLLMFISAENVPADYEKLKLATHMLELPASILLTSVVVLAFILDRS